MKYIAILFGLILLIRSTEAKAGEEDAAETVAILRLEPSEVDHSSQRIIVPRSAVTGDSVWVSVIGGVKEPGIYFVEKGTTISDLLRKIPHYPAATRTGLMVINNKSGTRVEFRTKDGSERELEISISHWLLKEGDVVFVMETVR